MAPRLAKNDIFFKTVLDAIPIYVFVVDEDIKILEYNQAAGSFFSGDPGNIILMRSGDAVNCIHSTETPEGCGHSKACGKCVIRNSVSSSFAGRKICRQKHKMRLISEGGTRDLCLSVTTNPFEYKGSKLVLLMLEDITEITELREIIPICAHCKKIRNDEQYWENVENFVLRYSDVKFSHGICPDCFEKFYPDLKE